MTDAERAAHIITLLDDPGGLSCDVQRALRDFICQTMGEQSDECKEAKEIVENNCGADPE